MANDITLNPIVVDTATDAIIVSGTFVVDFIRWTSGGSAGDLVTIQDKDGNKKWATVAGGTNYVEESHFRKPLIFNGLKVPTLQAGTIYIYVADAIPVKDS